MFRGFLCDTILYANSQQHVHPDFYQSLQNNSLSENLRHLYSNQILFADTIIWILFWGWYMQQLHVSISFIDEKQREFLTAYFSLFTILLKSAVSYRNKPERKSNIKLPESFHLIYVVLKPFFSTNDSLYFSTDAERKNIILRTKVLRIFVI